MEPKDRLKTMAVNLASAAKTQTVEAGGEKPTRTLAGAASVQAILDVWPAASKNAAEEIIAKYGPPNEAVPSRLIWYDNHPWKRTIVYRDEIPHNFPQPHGDVVEQVIDYEVPLDKLAEVLAFDGSLVIERTAGEVAARCDMEAANVASLNLMHDIVAGRIDADAARREMAEVASAYVLNREAPYAASLQFDPPQGGTKHPDKTIIGPAMLKQGLGKVKDALRPGDPTRDES
ncbi:MAG: hypothetical protein KY449_11910 [Proteobacteria bacterium]|nr:hypothetical protein [Pseudomonadota bacterium]